MKRHEWKWRSGCEYTERGQRAEGRWSTRDHEHARARELRDQGSHRRCYALRWSDGRVASWAELHETNAQRRRRIHDENYTGRHQRMHELFTVIVQMLNGDKVEWPTVLAMGER